MPVLKLGDAFLPSFLEDEAGVGGVLERVCANQSQQRWRSGRYGVCRPVWPMGAFTV